jgi:carboxylesterase
MHVEWFEGAEHRPFVLNGTRGSALLIHGFMGTPAEMRPLADELNNAGFTVYVPLLPGFGGDIANLGEVGRHDWLKAAGQIWEDLYQRGSADILLGFSMGGAVAMHLARDHSPVRLILIAPLWKLLGGDPKLNALPLIKYVIRHVKPFARADFSDPALRRFFEGVAPNGNIDDPAVQEMIRNEIKLPTRTLDELRRLAASSAKLAPEITAQTLVLQGTEDASVLSKHTRELVSKMNANARLVELSGEHLLVSDQRSTWPSVRDEVLDIAMEAVR